MISISSFLKSYFIAMLRSCCSKTGKYDQCNKAKYWIICAKKIQYLYLLPNLLSDARLLLLTIFDCKEINSHLHINIKFKSFNLRYLLSCFLHTSIVFKVHSHCVLSCFLHTSIVFKVHSHCTVNTRYLMSDVSLFLFQHVRVTLR